MPIWNAIDITKINSECVAMRKFVKFLFLASLSAIGLCSVASESEQQVYSWFCDVSASDVVAGIEILKGNNIIYKNHFGVCRLRRSYGSEESSKTGHVLKFTYKDNNASNPKLHSLIEGNIWLAGSESDLLLLGISFASKEGIFINTVQPVLIEESQEFTSSPHDNLKIKTFILE